MLPARRDRTVAPAVRGSGRLAVALLHYAACALVITIGVLGLLSIVLGYVFDAEPGVWPGWTVLSWIVIAGIFIGEVLLRPSFNVVAGIGLVALLLLSSCIVVSILVAIIL